MAITPSPYSIFQDPAAVIARLRQDQLLLAAQGAYPAVDLSDDYLWSLLMAAEAQIAQTLKVFLVPTVIFPYEPTADDLAALSGAPYAEEPGYDYDPGFFEADRWGYIVTRQHPIISVEYVRMAYPSPQQAFYTLPNDWLRLDKKYGHIRMVPASSPFTAPLGAFLMQAMSAGTTMPSMIQVKYTAGLKDVATDPRWANLVNVIFQQAVLNIINGAFLPNSGSISADGMSESMSVDASKYSDMINLALNGPKGSNGGLWTYIHGVTSTVAGVLA